MDAARISSINIDMCLPHLSSEEKREMCWQSLMNSMLLIFEIAQMRFRKVAQVREAIVSVDGAERLHQAWQHGQGVLLLTPHLGCWEILGAYLGGTFFAMANGLGAALAALIASIQPLLTTLLAIVLFNEKPRLIQWTGIFIGFAGVVVVISPSVGINAPMLSIISCVFGLLAITIGTLLQKRVGSSIGLLKSNIIQASAASLFFMILIVTVEEPHITWNEPFLIALAWQVLAVSAGAYVILMILIKRDSVAATTSLLFLVPPITAIIAFFVFGEPLTLVTAAGFIMASAGVYVVTRFSATEQKS